MHISLNYEKANKFFSKVVSQLEKNFLEKRIASPKKNTIPQEPNKWHWRIVGTSSPHFSIDPDLGKEFILTDVITRELASKNLELSLQANVEDFMVSVPLPLPHEQDFCLPEQVVEYINPKSRFVNNTLPTIFVYTEENRGHQLVESIVLGGMSSYVGDKFVVVKDPFNNINFVYKIDVSTNNLNAICMLRASETDFDKLKTLDLNYNSYRTLKANEAMELLGNKRDWIQDKSAVLSVLLKKADKNTALMSERPIKRPVVSTIPPDAKRDALVEKQPIRKNEPTTQKVDSGSDNNRRADPRIYV